MPVKIIYSIQKNLYYIISVCEIKNILDETIQRYGFSKFSLFPVNIRKNSDIDFFYKLIFRYSGFACRTHATDCSINVANSCSNIKYYSYQPIFYDISKMWESEWNNIHATIIRFAKFNDHLYTKILSILICSNNVGLVDDVVNIILGYYIMHLLFTTQLVPISLEQDYLHGVFTEKYFKLSSLHRHN